MYLTYYLLFGFIFWLFLFIAGRVHCPTAVDHMLSCVLVTFLWPVIFIKTAICMMRLE
ncbi:Uncharacterised protein [Klebsiella pneumoniae]|nr:Uncharacterised protein [Klebsiella pneumoniae]